MKKERRYNEKEIAAIFEQATTDQKKAKRNINSENGLTLKELEEIGRETGVAPEFIAKAAARLDSSYQIPEEKKLVGLPVQVNRTVQLPESFSDDDWDRLVVDLHDTFQVSDSTKIKADGRIRSWTNENTQVYVEPSGKGYRLRINSSNGLDVMFAMFGSIFLLMSLVFMVIMISKGKFMAEMDDTVLMFILSAVGLGAGGIGAFRIPSWYAKQSERVDGIIDRVLQHTEAEKPEVADPAAQSAKESPGIELEDLDQQVDLNQPPVRKRSKAK